MSSKECWTEVKSKGQRQVDKIQEKKTTKRYNKNYADKITKKKSECTSNYVALDGREKIPELVINHTNDNLIIKMDDDDTDSDKNIIKQHKKLKRTNEGY